MRRTLTAGLLVGLLLTTLPAITTEAIGNTIPDVHFTIIRVDFLTYRFKGFYEFSQPYQLSSPEPGYRQAGNIFWMLEPPGDFGYTKIKSRLTGELILYATTIWMGTGEVVYPPSSLMSTTIEYGYVNPEPDTLISLGLSYCPYYESEPDSAWARVANTDIINRIASRGSYEVYRWSHFYTVGMCDPSTAEYFIIAVWYDTSIPVEKSTWGRIKALYDQGVP